VSNNFLLHTFICTLLHVQVICYALPSLLLTREHIMYRAEIRYRVLMPALGQSLSHYICINKITCHTRIRDHVLVKTGCKLMNHRNDSCLLFSFSIS